MSEVKNAIIYCRVSDKKQILEGHSFEEQEPVLRKLAAREGYRVLKVFKDKAITGTSVHKRDAFKAAEQFIRAQNKDPNRKKLHALITWHSDRVARDEREHHRFRDDVLIEFGVQLITLNMTPDYETPEGLFADGVMANMNAYWSRKIGKHVKDMAKQLAPKGHTLHRAPLGYRNCRREEDGKTIKFVEVDKTKAPLVRQMFRLYSKGTYSLHAIAQYMNRRGLTTTTGKPLQASGLGEIIHNRYYLGKIKYNGKEYPGKHPPLISDQLFKQCEKILAIQRNHASRRRKPSNTKLFYLKDALKCGSCGYRVTGGGSKGRDGRYNYYYCGRLVRDSKYHSKKGNCVHLPEIHREVQDFFGLFELTPDIVEEVKNKAAQILSETHGDMDGERAEIQRKLTRLDHQRQKLEDLWLADEIVEDYYSRNHKTIEAEIAAAEQRLSEISGLRTDRTTIFEALVRLARDLPAAYENANPEVKRMYLKIFWDYFEIGGGTVQKAVPSKVVTALINEKHIVLKANSQNRKFLISKIWLPR